MEYMDGAELTKNKKDELLDVFSNSLVRTIGEEDEKFTIRKSPHYTELSRYGGSRTVEQYHTIIEYEKQRKLYTQRIPKDSENGSGGSGGTNGSSGSSEKTKLRTGVMYYAELKLLSDSPVTSGVVESFPRGAIQTVEFIRDLSSTSKSRIVYFGPCGMFAVGEPGQWNQPELLNLKASSLFGGIPLYGDVTVFRKKPISVVNLNGEPKKKRKKKDGDDPMKDVKDPIQDGSETNQDLIHPPEKKKMKKTQKKGESGIVTVQELERKIAEARIDKSFVPSKVILDMVPRYSTDQFQDTLGQFSDPPSHSPLTQLDDEVM